MSKEKLNFSYYINNFSTLNTKSFKKRFKNRINNLSGSSSSKILIKDLGISLREDFKTFRNVYMEFFTWKINNDYQVIS